MAENNVNVKKEKILETCEKAKKAIWQRLAYHVGRTKNMIDEGFSIAEIATKLKVSEDEVRSYIKIIEKAEENRQKMNG